MVANPAACGQLDRENNTVYYFLSLSPFAPENLLSGETSSAVSSRVSLLVLHTQFESGAYSRDSSRCPRRRPHKYIHIINIPSTAIGSISSLSQMRTDGVHCRESSGIAPSVVFFEKRGLSFQVSP